MTLFLGALTIGLILSLLALGIYISYRVFDVADITVDGSITFGAAIGAVLIVRGIHPLLATLAGFAGGLVAGAVTGILQAKFKLNSLLSGILVMTSLYSVNLPVMGKSNAPLLTGQTLTTWAERLGRAGFGKADVNLLGWLVSARDLVTLRLTLGIVVVVCLVASGFFRTELGTAMRWGLNPNDLKLVTALFVFAALVLPQWLPRGLKSARPTSRP
jgi:putative tryptophan/tyrosine transport system permease protein